MTRRLACILVLLATLFALPGLCIGASAQARAWLPSRMAPSLKQPRTENHFTSFRLRPVLAA